VQSGDTVIVVIGGGSSPSRPALPDARAVVAADGGLERAQALRLRVDAVVGDFDSVDGAAVEAARAAGARVERHPEDKDATDLELALGEALSYAPRRVLVVGGGDGRLDHLLGAVLALASPRLEEVEVDAMLGPARLHVVRAERTLTGEEGELVSLLPVGGAAEGVVTSGLRYPLAGETLEPGSSRGVSNVFAAREARISLERGVLLAIRPGAR
jgi:thiamine pyrophosphokinase